MNDHLDPASVVVSCVLEQKHPYNSETVMLYRTLDGNGGPLSNARRRAVCVGPLDDETTGQLEALGVEIVFADPIIPEYPHANKIRMFEAREGDELIVAVDTDVTVAGDFSGWLDPNAAACKPVDQTPLSEATWRRVFNYFGLELPTARYMTHFNADLVVPYFNTGVVVMPARYTADLREVWERYVRELWANYGSIDEEIANEPFFTDQYAFALTLVDLEIPMMPLPIEMNFPTHWPVHPLFEPDKVEPLLVHHHHRTENGRVLPTAYAGPNRSIAKINTALDRFLDGSSREQASRSWASSE